MIPMSLSPVCLLECQCFNSTIRPSLFFIEQIVGDIYNIWLSVPLFRFGLWVADLSITQIFQENVEESQRGVLGNYQCCGSASRWCGSGRGSGCGSGFDLSSWYGSGCGSGFWLLFDADPDFYLIRIRILLFTLMRIRTHILASQ